METVKVKLLKAHTHGNKEYQAGDEIEVTPEDAKWLAHHDRQVIDGNASVSASAADAPGMQAGGAGTSTQTAQTGSPAMRAGQTSQSAKK